MAAYPSGFNKAYWPQMEQQNRPHDDQGYWNQPSQGNFAQVRKYPQQHQAQHSSQQQQHSAEQHAASHYNATNSHANSNIYGRQTPSTVQPNGQAQSPAVPQVSDSDRLQWQQQHTRVDNTAAEALSRLSGATRDRYQLTHSPQQSHVSPQPHGQQSSYEANHSSHAQTHQQRQGYTTLTSGSQEPPTTLQQQGAQAVPLNTQPQRHAHGGDGFRHFQAPYQTNDRNDNAAKDFQFRPGNQRLSASQNSRPTSPLYNWSNAHDQQPQHTARYQASPVSNETQHSRSSSIAQLRGQSITPSSVQQQAQRGPGHLARPPTENVQHTTVDPTQVYDRWPEQQRMAQQIKEQRERAEAVERARKEAEERARREEAVRLAAAAEAEHKKQEDLRRAHDQLQIANAQRIAQEARQEPIPAAAAQTAIQRTVATDAKKASKPRKPRGRPSKASLAAAAAAAGTATAEAPTTAKAPAAKSAPTKPAPIIPEPRVTQTTAKSATHMPGIAVGLANAAKTSATTPTAQAALSGTWKTARKRRLAEMIVKWLTGQPANQGVEVDQEEVVKLLEENAPYATFCDFLDSKGFWLNRAMLARIILDSNPELNKSPAIPSKPAHIPAGNNVALPPAGQHSQPAPPALSLAQPDLAPVTQPEPSYSQQLPQQPTSGSLDAVHSTPGPAPVMDDTPMHHDEPMLGTDEAPTPSLPPTAMQAKKSKVKTVKGALSEATNPTAEPDRPKTPLSKADQARHRGSTAFDALVLDSSDGEDDYIIAPRPQSAVDPMLSATLSPSSLPSDQPSKDTGGTLEEAIATGPPVVYVPSVLESELRGKVLIEPLKRAEVARKSKYDSRTIARDVLLATGRHSGMRPLNDHLEGIRALLATHSQDVDNQQYDLNTIRWNLIDPEPAQENADDTLMADDEQDELNMPVREIVHRDGTVSLAPAQRAPGAKRKRGPGKKWARRQGNVPGVNVAAGGASMPSGGMRRSIFKPSFAGKQGKAEANENSDTAMAGSQNGHSDRHQGSSRRAGSANLGAADERDHLSEPHFPIFKCRWERCDAKLHSIEALSKHIEKLHGRRSRGLYQCAWGTCSKGGRTITGPGDRLQFEVKSKWDEHVRGAHLDGVVRRLGDGPRGNASDGQFELSDAYLSDRQGRRVTPRATLSSIFNAEQLAQEQLLGPVLRQDMPRLPGGLTESQRSDEQKLQQLEAKKLALGPMFERGGARLATDERRRGLYDDEDFEGEYSADEGVPDIDE